MATASYSETRLSHSRPLKINMQNISACVLRAIGWHDFANYMNFGRQLHPPIGAATVGLLDDVVVELPKTKPSYFVSQINQLFFGFGE